MYCGFCGVKLKDGSKFCGQCGKPTKAPAAKQPTYASPIQSAAPNVANPQPMPTPQISTPSASPQKTLSDQQSVAEPENKIGELFGNISSKLDKAIASSSTPRFTEASAKNSSIAPEDLRIFLIEVAVAVVLFVICAIAAVTYHNGLWGNATAEGGDYTTIVEYDAGIGGTN